MLQYVPPLPPSIECFGATDCISLKTVSGLTNEPPKKHKAIFQFHNCTNLDQHAYEAVLKDLNFRIELEEITALEEEEGYLDDVNNGIIFYYLPSKDTILNDWLLDCSTQAFVTIEVPPYPKISGLIFYLLFSEYQSCYLDQCVIFRCKCYLETSCNEWVNIASSSSTKQLAYSWGKILVESMSNHVLLCYDARYYKKIMEAIQETNRGAIYNLSLKFEFSTQTEDDEEVVLKGCRIRWISPRVKEGGESRDDIEDYESDKPQEVVPPTRNLGKVSLELCPTWKQT